MEIHTNTYTKQGSRTTQNPPCSYGKTKLKIKKKKNPHHHFTCKIQDWKKRSSASGQPSYRLAPVALKRYILEGEKEKL